MQFPSYFRLMVTLSPPSSRFASMILLHLNAQDKKVEKAINVQRSVLSIDKSTISVRTGTASRQVVFGSGTKFLYGHSNDNKRDLGIRSRRETTLKVLAFIDDQLEQDQIPADVRCQKPLGTDESTRQDLIAQIKKISPPFAIN